MTDDYILIATDDATLTVLQDASEMALDDDWSDSSQGQKGGRPTTGSDWRSELQQKAQQAVGTATQITTTTLEVNMNRFLRFVGRMFKQVDRQIGTDSDMTLDEVELSIEISGKGEIKLVAGAEAKSAITLKFKRVEKT